MLKARALPALLAAAIALALAAPLAASSLSVTVGTDRRSYRRGDTVLVSGAVSWGEGAPMAALVSITVRNPEGAVVFSKTVQPSMSGNFSVSVAVGEGWLLGRYLVDAVAYAGSEMDSATAYFYVREPSAIRLVVPERVVVEEPVELRGDIDPDPGVVRVRVVVEGPANETLTVFTNELGEFSVTWIPKSVGRYALRAEWEGTSTLEGSVSQVVEVEVAKKPSAIALSVEPEAVEYGCSVTIAGRIEPEGAGRGRRVLLTYSLREGGEGVIAEVTADEEGAFSVTWAPPRAGNYTIRASWRGSDLYEGAVAEVTLVVERARTAIELFAEPLELKLGMTVTLMGRLLPGLSGVPVVLEAELNGTWVRAGGAVTNATGGFSLTWTPQHAGAYRLRARWAGSENYRGAVSSPVRVMVLRAETQLSVEAIPAETPMGRPVLVVGTLRSVVTGAGVPGAAVIVILTSPLGGVSEYSVVTDSEGRFKLEVAPEVAGPWLVSARWLGSDDFYGAESGSVRLLVEAQEVNMTVTMCGPQSDGVEPRLKAVRSTTLTVYLATNSTVKSLLAGPLRLELSLEPPEGSAGYLAISIPKGQLESLGLSLSDLRVEVSRLTAELELREGREAVTLLVTHNESASVSVKLGAELSVRVVDAKGRPVAGALVLLARAGELVNATTSSASGTCRFVGLRPGKYALSVRWMGQALASEWIELVGDANETVVLTLHDLRVSVKGLLGLPARGASVSLVRGNSTLLTLTTAADGSATFPQLPEGNYTVVASSLGSAAGSVRLSGDAELTLRLATPLDLAVAMVVVAAAAITVLTARRRLPRP